MAHKTSFWVALVALSVPLAGCGGDEEKHDAGARGSAEPTGDEGDEDLLGGLSQEDAAKVLAKVDGTTITLGEFVRRINEQSPFLRARYNSPERRREFLDNLIRFELLAREAERRGYGDDTEVQRTLKQAMIQRLMKQEFEARVKISDIPEDAIRKYYEEHSKEYNKPAQVRASHILLKDRATADRILRDVLAKAGDARAFRELARQHSDDESSKSRGGDLRYFSLPEDRLENEPDVPEEMARAAFTIQNVGEVHRELVKTSQGFHILKLTGKHKALKRDLEEVRRTIQNRLWREKRQSTLDQFVEDLRREVGVTIDDAALGDVRVDTTIPEGAVPGSEPRPGMPGIESDLPMPPGREAPSGP